MGLVVLTTVYLLIGRVVVVNSSFSDCFSPLLHFEVLISPLLALFFLWLRYSYTE